MNAVIYARYSSDSQREESIEGQLRECGDYADRNGMTVVGSYIDRALSAKTADRPEFQRMVKDSAKGLFEIVLVWKLDRFSRDHYDITAQIGSCGTEYSNGLRHCVGTEPSPAGSACSKASRKMSVLHRIPCTPFSRRPA